MTSIDVPDVWRGAVLRLPGGQVLLAGSALLEVARAMQAAERGARANGIEPPERWRRLMAQLLAAASDVPPPSVEGNGELPQPTGPSTSVHDDLVDSREAAEMLGCTPRNVRYLADRGVLMSGRKPGGRLLLERSEVEAEARRRAEARRAEEERCA